MTTRPLPATSACAMHKRRPRSISALTIILRKLTVTRGRIHTRVPPGLSLPLPLEKGAGGGGGGGGLHTKGKNAQRERRGGCTPPR